MHQDWLPMVPAKLHMGVDISMQWRCALLATLIYTSSFERPSLHHGKTNHHSYPREKGAKESHRVMGSRYKHSHSHSHTYIHTQQKEEVVGGLDTSHCRPVMDAQPNISASVLVAR